MMVRVLRVAFLVSFGTSSVLAGDQARLFLAEPYLQLGHSASVGKLDLLWLSTDADLAWKVEYRPGRHTGWRSTPAPSYRKVRVEGMPPHRVYEVTLKNLPPGSTFSYRVSLGDRQVFESEAHAPKSAGQPHRFVAFGDCGDGSPNQKAIAYRAFQAHPDLVLIPGDIVYDRGRATEYRDRFWPIFNADTPSPDAGAPLMRSTLFVAAPGNHDIGARDLGRYPDGLSYFYYWSQPINGPEGREGGPMTSPLVGPEVNRLAFREAAGPAFPRMANFSFDFGDVHWTVLDSNPSVNWNDLELRRWVEQDLAVAKGASWRFVTFHHPGFHSSRSHGDEEQMRTLASVFEAGKVSLVFSGHVHNYQRSYPLTFVPETASTRPDGRKDRRVAGRWTLDRSFDGRSDTTPEGIIYLVTGAGGRHLYNPEQQDDTASWKEFTVKHVSKVFSMTVVDVEGRTVRVQRVGAEGQIIDQFVMSR